MMLFVEASILLTVAAFGLTVLIQKKMIWGYRGELFILVSCLYLVSVFFIARIVFLIPILATSTDEYSAKVMYDGGTIHKFSFERIRIPLVIKNIGSKAWDSHAQTGPVLVSYHLLTTDGTMLSYDNIRTPFQNVVMPSETIAVDLQVQLPPPGEYILQVDIVAENVTWFKEQGTQPVDIVLNIIDPLEHISQPVYEFETFKPKLL